MLRISRQFFRCATTILIVAGTLGTSTAHASLIQNGDFATGDLSNWSLFNYSSTGGGATHGSLGVTGFNVTGLGSSNAATFQAGATGTPSFGSYGGGISQTVSLVSGGEFSLSVDIAQQNISSIGGELSHTFELLLDNVIIASLGGTPIAAFGGIYRDSLAVSGLNITAGNHDIALRMHRFTNNGSRQFFKEYVDNFTLLDTTAPVPLPAAAWLFGSGLIGLLGIGRIRSS